MPRKGWNMLFDDPIELPNGKIARTLGDARAYALKLPTSEYMVHPEWARAMKALMQAAEGQTLIAIARIGMMKAINRADEPRWGPGKRVVKDRPWGRRKLARDR
jgi:hypothetical protein